MVIGNFTVKTDMHLLLYADNTGMFTCVVTQ